MAHDHERHTIHDVELPDAISGTSHFFDGDTQYTIKRDRENMWMVFGMFRPGKATPLVTIHPRENGWEVMDVNGEGRRAGDDWRLLLRQAL